MAARNGLLGHTKLYLHYGAALEKNNDEGKTPLNSACSHPQELQDLERYLQVCRLLLEAGADVHALDQDKQSPLHMACKNVNPEVVDLLLARGACVNEMDYGGQAPMHNVLKVVCYKISHKPERVVRSLLNHGSIRVWPGALPKVRASRLVGYVVHSSNLHRCTQIFHTDFACCSCALYEVFKGSR